MTDHVPPSGGDRSLRKRYHCLEVPEAEVVIYDGENHERWLQADRYVALATMR